MKKIITIFILFLVLGLWGEKASFADEKTTQTDTSTETATEEEVGSEDYVEKNYTFPLDEMPNNFSIYDYDFTNSTTSDLKETTIEKSSKTTAEEEAEFSRDMELTSDTVDFYPEVSQYIAKKNARLVIQDEQLQLTANEIIVDQRNYEIIGIGNVKIVKNGTEYFGDYIRINTKKESSFFNNPILYYSQIVINAKSATMHADETIAKEGSAVLKPNKVAILSTSRFGGVRPAEFFDLEKQFDTDSHNYKIKAKKMIVKRESDRTDIIMKNASVYRAGIRVGFSPNLILATDKDVNYIETSFPEIGKREMIGTYIAPSFVVPMPKASTLKLGPLISLDTHSNIGFGGFGRLYTPKSKTEAYYSSNISKFVLDGEYEFTNNLRLQYAANDYMRSSWMGGQMPNYGIELVHEKQYIIPQANMKYDNWLSFGFFEDTEKYGRKDPLRTFRYRWQGDAYNQKPLLAWEKYLMLGYSYQHDFSLYQTGHTAGVLRAGPRLYSDLGRLSLDVTYYMAGQLNRSPYYFDRYRYGQNNVRLRTQFYVNKYLSLAYIGSLNVSERDFTGKRLTENQLIAAVGTDDLKLRFGWDVVRNTALVGMDMFLGTNKTMLEFDEMKVEKFEPAKGKEKSKRKKAKL